MLMASSEIEIVSDANDHHNSAADIQIVDVFSASIYGDLQKLRKFVEEDGASVSEPDGNGFYPLQWASLNNFANIAQYIIEHGGDVHATDSVLQTALHWAAVRGSIDSAEVLLQNGARVEACDANGYRAVHVAAQYGQTVFMCHIIMKYRADYDVPDNDGRCPLHWAAYRGFADIIRLLLYKDASQARQDKSGYTPLHWAALMGNVEACSVLVHTGTKLELMVKNNDGFTPIQLASDKGHRDVALFLSRTLRSHGNQWTDKLCFGELRNGNYAPFVFCIIFVNVFLFISSILHAPTLSRVTAVVGLWGWTGVSLAVVSLMMLVRCSSKDPGFIKSAEDKGNCNHAEDPLLTIDLSNTSKWTGNWSQLCPTCKIIRPIRSKHCPVCKCCVEQFDHHCPWISNCVGKKNRWDFFVFLCLGFLTSFIGDAVAVQRIWTSLPTLEQKETWILQYPGIIAFLAMDSLFLLATTTLLILQAYQIARNLTTNELANYARYEYLRGPDGRFRNPYSRGCRKNCSDFLIHGYSSDDELAWPPVQR